MATLTIADLDNGKRDLQTVDAIANSPADTTVTRFGNQTLTLAGALRRLGWQAPVPYAAGISITGSTTTVARGGIVYRPDPAIVPFTTGAWNPAQWRVIQNSFDADRVAVFDSYALMMSAAATIADQTVALVLRDEAQWHKRTLYRFSAGTAIYLGVMGKANSTEYQAQGTGGVVSDVQTRLDEVPTRSGYDSVASFNAAKAGRVSIDAEKRVRSPAGFATGNEEFSGATKRDAFIAGRTVAGQTDCHAFADRTVMENVTDAGTYGSFDATVTLRGSHAQDHVAGYQFRPTLAGTGPIANLWGGLIWPTSTGTSTFTNVVGWQIQNVTGAGSIVKNNRGIDISPFATTEENIGVLVRNGACVNSPPKSFLSDQDINGFSFYSRGLGYFYNRGKALIGDFGSFINPASSATLSVKNPTSAVVALLDSDDVHGAVLGVSGNKPISFASNATIAGRFENSANSRGFTPGVDNAQPLGLISKRWAIVYSATGTINTSDEREKTAWRTQSEAEHRAALEIKTSIKAFKWVEAVNKKGESARWHFGVGAQTVGSILKKYGLRPEDYAFWCFDEWEGGDRFGIRYDELAMFLIAAL